MALMGASRTILVNVESGDLSPLVAIRADLSEQYNKKHSHPWIIAYSDDKEATL